MHRPSRTDVLIAAASAALISAMALAGVPEMLGAHPWWAPQTGILGGVGGAFVFLGLRMLRPSHAAVIAAVAMALLLSALSVYWGKKLFVESFADNTLAGRFWYFGWYALSGSVAVGIGSAGAWLRRS